MYIYQAYVTHVTPNRIFLFIFSLLNRKASGFPISRNQHYMCVLCRYVDKEDALISFNRSDAYLVERAEKRCNNNKKIQGFPFSIGEVEKLGKNLAEKNSVYIYTKIFMYI